ncbi:MAG: glyoxylate/hydroxypyruvate reductase A, partial [Alphaproteobacteria bacterium]
DARIRVWPDIGDPSDITFAVVWNPPSGFFADLDRLAGVCVMGAGTDAILAKGEIPESVPVARVVDPVMSNRMAEYVLAATLRFQRRFDDYALQQSRQEWQRLPQKDAGSFHVAVLGLGQIGRLVAGRLAANGFKVGGWSRTAREIEGIECHTGSDGLARLVSWCDLLVNLLPLTTQTRGLLDRDVFWAMPVGGGIVNCARGAHVVTADLLQALDTGQLSYAMLDVFETEPPAADDPVWSHPRVHMTPHVSSITNIETALPQIVAAYDATRAGRPMANRVNRKQGY